MSDSEDPIDAADEGDLFGDGGDGDGADGSDDGRPLSDHELDEEEQDARRRSDRGSVDSLASSQGRPQPEQKSQLVMDLQMHRHRTPKPKDGILRSLKIPEFLKLIPEEYKADSYEPDEWDLLEDGKKYPAQAVRYRRNEETGKMESNSVVYRWSDGSFTVAVGEEHFELEVRKLAPDVKSYDEKKDANYYAAAAHMTANSLVTVGHITEEFKVRPSKRLEDAAVNRLMAKMDAANKRRNADGDVIFRATEDPEQARKQAEQLEKDRERARRRKENQAARADGAITGGRYARGALSMGALDGERGSGAAGGQGGRRAKGAGAGSRQKRRRPEYDSDDDLPQGARRQDDYDMGDAFIAPSDEDLSEEADEDEEEEILDDDDDDDDGPPRSKRRKTAETPRDEDADGEADLDDAPAAHADVAGRRNRRHIVDDDDD